MHIKFIEVQNFRKLKSIRIDLSTETTLLVGANNSGKTSAMVALRHFLVEKNRFSTNDFTLSNWIEIEKIGATWEAQEAASSSFSPSPTDWNNLLPSMDVWLQVAQNEIHHIRHLLPTLDWDGGPLGVRLRLEPNDLNALYKEFIISRKAAKATIAAAKAANGSANYGISLWPASMKEFLERGIGSKLTLRAYVLDPNKLNPPLRGVARPQPLSPDIEFAIERPFEGLIRIDEINAQRGFADASNAQDSAVQDGEDVHERGGKKKLSEQLRSYYAKHIDPSQMPEPSDVEALDAVFKAQTLFDEKLKLGFKDAFSEVQDLGYPGVTDPRLSISTKIRPIDGFSHPSALQYEVVSKKDGTTVTAPCLPEQYNGLGYQNLISMVFRLMSFRDGWMQVGKAGKKVATAEKDAEALPPLHLVLIEEPEAHLHVQVQQVFIRKAYEILRAHDDLGDKKTLTTQLIVSTHSSHVAHESEFSSLRYFRRMPAIKLGDVPTSTVVNLSEVFGAEVDTQKFATRYLRATHCDLFFADAAILVEGPAERMLVPHFIREHFSLLNQRYVTILEIGGSHAHRLRPLIEHLGLTTLIITDLDCADAAGHHPARQPVRGQNQITRNSTIKTWVPELEPIDAVLNASSANKLKTNPDDQLFSVRVAYQSPIQVQLAAAGQVQEALSNTFEDSLVFENITFFRELEGDGLIKQFREAIAAAADIPALGQAMFTILKEGNKAQFALDLLYTKEPKLLKVPTYIADGLNWLQEVLKEKQNEVVATESNAVAQANGQPA